MVKRPISLYGRKLRFRIERFTQGDDFDDSKAGTWACIRSFSATLVPDRPKGEFVSSAQMHDTKRFTVDIRTPKHMCMTTSDRLVRLDNGNVYNIDGMAPLDERETWLTLNVVKTDVTCKC